MHFQDDNWVKLALLTWDSVTRVRARDVDDRDSELVRQVKDETDLLKEISPSQNDLIEVAHSFEEVLETLGDRVDARYGQNQRGWEDDRGVYSAPWINTGFSFDAPDYLTWVYCGAKGTKIGDALRHQLVGRKLGLPHGSWLGMHPKLASIYLATLADAIARHNRISPATDDTRMHHAVGALDHLAELLFGHRPASTLDDPENAFVHVALQAVIKPDRLANVPVDKLIRFRGGHTAELTAFREHVAGLADELREIAMVENVDIVHAHLESLYRTRTKPQLDDLRRALRSLGVESTAGTLGLKVDLNAAAGTVIGSIAAAGGQLAVAGAAVAMTVLPYLAGRFKARREAITSSPVAYLLAAHRKLPNWWSDPTSRDLSRF
jgi:hypothetical protein